MIKVPEVLLKKRIGPQGISSHCKTYKRPAMFQAKVHYFTESELWRNRNLVILGAGDSGRMVVKGLLEKGFSLQHWADPKSETTRHIFDIPITPTPDLQNLSSWLAQIQSRLILCCVGNPQAKEKLADLFKELQWEEGRDWLFFL